MTDPAPTPDELVSAYADGEATPEERAAVEADPELLARVQLFRALGEWVGEPVEPAPAGHRDAAIAAALDASPTATSTVRSLDVARARRRRSPRVIAIASVAAVVALVLLVVPIVLDSGSDEADLASEVADETTSTEAPAEDPADAPNAADGSAGGQITGEVNARDLAESGADASAEAPAAALEAEAPSFDDAEAGATVEEPAEEAAADVEAEFADEPAAEALGEFLGNFADGELIAEAARAAVTDADRSAAFPTPTVCGDSIAEVVEVVDVVLEANATLDTKLVNAIVLNTTDVDGSVIERTLIVAQETCAVVLVSDG